MQKIEMVRLVADEGKVLTNGDGYASCVDVCPVSRASEWSEIDMPEELKNSDQE